MSFPPFTVFTADHCHARQRTTPDTRRWAFYNVGAMMVPADTGVWHGPVSSTRALQLARFVRCSPASAIACQTDTGAMHGPVVPWSGLPPRESADSVRARYELDSLRRIYPGTYR